MDQREIKSWLDFDMWLEEFRYMKYLFRLNQAYMSWYWTWIQRTQGVENEFKS